MKDFKELREALEAGPTDGPWVAAGPSFGSSLPVYCNEVVTDRADEDDCETVCQAPSEFAAEVTVDMHYIAAANPATIRSLLAELDEARRDAERLDWLSEHALSMDAVADPGNMTIMFYGTDPCRTAYGLTLRSAIDEAMEEQQP